MLPLGRGPAGYMTPSGPAQRHRRCPAPAKPLSSAPLCDGGCGMGGAIVAGNWKMHGTKQRALRFCQALGRADIRAEVEVVVFPPVAYLSLFAAATGGLAVELGAQDLHPLPEGPRTGDISGAMIAELGGRWALAGHSERRIHHGEDDALVAAKVGAALAAGLKPMLCVGETLEQRQANQAEAVVERQLRAVLDAVGVAWLSQGAIAYEPVWAIGTGVTAAPGQAEAMHGMIREWAASQGAQAVRVLYGGSVNQENAAELFSQPNIDGGLVGGASLDAESFLAIVAAAG